jgi:hypothetical protein
MTGGTGVAGQASPAGHPGGQRGGVDVSDFAQLS